MTNRNGAKGSSFERLIADYLQIEVSEFIDRRVKTGAKDKGDIANFRVGKHRLVVECKTIKKQNPNEQRPPGLNSWVLEAQEEAENDDAVAGIVVHKRTGKGQPGDQYVTMTLDDFLTIIAAAGAN